MSLEAPATEAGLAVEWSNYKGTPQRVSPETLRAVLKGLGLSVQTNDDIAHSRKMIADAGASQPRLQIAFAGERLSVGRHSGIASMTLEGGTEHNCAIEDGQITLPDEPGYHQLHHRDTTRTIAIAPRRCWTLPDQGVTRGFGIGTQVYALRGGSTRGFGDLGAVAECAEATAPLGVDALMLSPLHALRAADPGIYQPYSPSTRLALNGLFADLGEFGLGERPSRGTGLIDWQKAGPRKMVALRAAFAQLPVRAPGPWREFERFARTAPQHVLDHASFEAIDADMRAKGIFSSREWSNLHQPADSDIVFHVFVQWLTQRSLQAAQRRATAAGMKIGLITDLAIGMSPDGSHAWAHPSDVLDGLAIGAPPDLLGPDGQNWGLTALSPRAMADTGYCAFIDTLRAALDGAGGLRIDHAMSLRRLWVIPEGGNAADGVYLTYPMEDLLRILAIESHRHRAIIIGEDLGTVPPGFREALIDAGIYGMRVLWFEQDETGFTAPPSWPARSIAMTGTHDLPTLAGWWAGSDIGWREKVRGRPDPEGRANRAAEKKKLVHAMEMTGGVAPHNRDDFANAALSFIGTAGSDMLVVPAEDLYGLVEQPNLPGTIDEHPNWRRRLPAPSPKGDEILRANIARVTSARKSS